ncbi:MAG: homocysteine S-methyltransferase family protein [Euzebya sp.]
MSRPNFLKSIAAGPVICAEGYLFELERRGYLQAGPFVPTVVLDHPEKVEALHREFVHAGSDAVEAFTYYAHREKMRVVGKEDLIEPLNQQALEIARKVADETGTMLAGNVCNTNIYDPTDPDTHKRIRAMFTEQVGWAADAGVDYMIGETFSYAEEALIALDVIQEAGLPAVMMLAVHRAPETREGWTVGDACARLADAGADVVGLNCIRGPETMLPLVQEVLAAVDIPVAALPVPYRTTPAEPSFQSLRDPDCEVLPSGIPFPTALDPFTCNRYEMADFTVRAQAAGVRYFGVCCGAGPHHIRAMSQALGRTPPADSFSEDMTKHAFLGSDDKLSRHNLAYGGQL